MGSNGSEERLAAALDATLAASVPPPQTEEEKSKVLVPVDPEAWRSRFDVVELKQLTVFSELLQQSELTAEASQQWWQLKNASAFVRGCGEHAKKHFAAHAHPYYAKPCDRNMIRQVACQVLLAAGLQGFVSAVASAVSAQANAKDWVVASLHAHIEHGFRDSIAIL